MKYMLLIYGAEDAWSEDERSACYTESAQLIHELQSQGHFLGANPLHSISSATSVRVRNGRAVVTDGPFAETREQLGGYFLVEARDLNEAIQIAGRIPGARKKTVEVRPVLEISGIAVGA